MHKICLKGLKIFFQPTILMTLYIMPSSWMNKDQLKKFQRRHLCYARWDGYLNIFKHGIFDAPSELLADPQVPIINSTYTSTDLSILVYLNFYLVAIFPLSQHFRITLVSCLSNKLTGKSKLIMWVDFESQTSL